MVDRVSGSEKLPEKLEEMLTAAGYGARCTLEAAIDTYEDAQLILKHCTFSLVLGLIAA